MTHEEYNRFAEELQRRGYKKYPSPRYSIHREDYAWFKSFGESKFEEDRSNYQVCFDVFDFSPYADREPFFRDSPYSIEPQILISRTINERIDLHLSYTKVDDTNIDEIERLAESFYRWAEKEIKVTIETKYSIGQEVWFLFDGKPLNGKIARISECTIKVNVIFKDGKEYVFIKDIKDFKLFPTKEELIKSL